jgi:hypothetical protein
MVERFNGTLKMILRLLCEDYLSDWVHYLQPAVFSYNTSAAESIGTSPYAALYGRGAHFPFSVSYSMGGSAGAKPFEEFKVSQDKYLRGAHHFIKAMLDKSRLDVAAKNMQHARINAFVPSDLVWLRNALAGSLSGTFSTTLQFDGPFRVLRRSGDVNYFIERVSPRKSEKEIMVHVSRLKKCVLKSPTDPAAVSATPSRSPPAELSTRLQSLNPFLHQQISLSCRRLTLPSAFLPSHDALVTPLLPRNRRLKQVLSRLPSRRPHRSLKRRPTPPCRRRVRTLLSLLRPSMILLQTSLLFQWTRLKHLLEFSVVPDFLLVLTTISRSSSVNQFSLLSLSTLPLIASANG